MPQTTMIEPIVFINYLNDYRPTALTPLVITCLERIVLFHIGSSFPLNSDSYQFTYRCIALHSENDIYTELHHAMAYLEKPVTHICMFFVYLSIQHCPIWKTGERITELERRCFSMNLDFKLFNLPSPLWEDRRKCF